MRNKDDFNYVIYEYEIYKYSQRYLFYDGQFKHGAGPLPFSALCFSASWSFVSGSVTVLFYKY